ncbi:MAG: carbohydrate deacetylase, partial [Solirubrobacteraceae bacterium]
GEPLHHLISPSALASIIHSLPPGITELACHPGIDPELESPYAAERQLELSALCHGRVLEAGHASGVERRSFDRAAP